MPVVLAIIPIIAAVVVPILVTGTIVIAGLTIALSAIIIALITIAATVATVLLTKKKGRGISGNTLADQGAVLQTKVDPTLPRTVLCGNTAAGPSVHYTLTYTDDSAKPNRYLVRVLQISDMPIDSILAIYEGNQTLTFAGDITAGWQACNQHLNVDGGPAMWMRVYTGALSGAVADATLISISGGLWTSNHKGTGLAYAIVKYDYDANAFPNGEPELVFAVHGAHCYDDRFDSTVAGGSGSQRIASPGTWAYSENSAVVAAQYLRGFYNNGKKIVGVGAEARDLLPAMLFSAYNTCDQSVASKTGTEARYACGINFTSDETAQTALQDISLAMDGDIFDRGGSITIWPGAVRTPVLTISEQDINWTTEKSWQPRASLDQLVNAVGGNFVDATNYYQARDLPIRTNSSWEADDGGQRFSRFLSLRAVYDWSQAQRVTHRIFQSGRFNGIAAFVGGIWLIELEQGDWFTMSSVRWGMTTKYFEVQEITLTTDLQVAIIATEVSTTLDDWAPASNEFDRTDTFWNAPSYNLVVPTFTVAPYTLYDSLSGVQTFGFTFHLSSPNGRTGSFGEEVEIQYALTGALTTTYSAGLISVDQSSVVRSGLSPSTGYSVRARTTGRGRVSAWSSWATLTTTTANTAFASALAGIANDDILTTDEKRQLLAIYNDVEQRYSAALARGTELALSTTALSTAHTNWLNYLAGITPPWNDTTVNSSIYTGLFPDEAFPTGWTLTSATSTPVAPWTNVTDSSGAAQGSISRSVACAGLTQYSIGILIQKDAVDQTTRNPIIQMVTSGGTAKTGTLAINSKTGVVAANASLSASGSTDMGDSWFVWATMTTNTGNTNITYNIFPAGSTGLSTTVSNTPTGSVKFRRPVLTQGDITDLGADAMIGQETALVLQIEAIQHLISQLDGSTSIVIAGPAQTVIQADITGTVKTGQLPRSVNFTAGSGITDYTTLGTWSFTQTPTAGITATINSGTGALNITAVAAASTALVISFIYGGVTRTFPHTVIRQNDPPTSGGGGSGGSGSSSTTTLGATTGATYDTTNAVSATLTCTATGGGVRCAAPIGFVRTTSSSGSSDVWGKWQWRVVAGTFADIATEVESTSAASTHVTNDPNPGDYTQFEGTLSVTQTKTGLTNGTNYEFRFLWRNNSGTIPVYLSDGTLTATGT